MANAAEMLVSLPGEPNEDRNRAARRTATDDIFDDLYSAITSLRLEPGARVSEIEVAKQYDVSRQPVREAFIRLSNLNLLQVRPQRATIVRKISEEDIKQARFVRIAVEVEVARRACEAADGSVFPLFDKNLAAQSEAVAEGNYDRFHKLDYEFHYLLCKAAQCEFAFRTIADNKSQVDRLCALSLSKRAEFEDVYRDHVNIFGFLKARDTGNMVALLRKHLLRLDATIAQVRKTHKDFFED